GLGHEQPDQRRLAGAGLTGEEQVAAAGEQIECVAEFVGDNDPGHGRTLAPVRSTDPVGGPVPAPPGLGEDLGQRPLGSSGTSTAYFCSASSGTTSRVASWVAASTTGAA